MIYRVGLLGWVYLATLVLELNAVPAIAASPPQTNTAEALYCADTIDKISNAESIGRDPETIQLSLEALSSKYECMRPFRASITDSLFHAYYNIGDFWNAALASNDCVENYPQSASCFDDKTRILMKQNDFIGCAQFAASTAALANAQAKASSDAIASNAQNIKDGDERAAYIMEQQSAVRLSNALARGALTNMQLCRDAAAQRR